MSILNRRNAVLGWAVWTTTKRMAARTAKKSVSGGNSRRPSVPLVAATFAGLAGAVGALAFWRRHSGDAPA